MLHVARFTLFHCVKEITNYDKNAALNCLWDCRKGTADMTTPHCSGGRYDTRLNNTALYTVRGYRYDVTRSTIPLVELAV
jgi:hypothetical protein